MQCHSPTDPTRLVGSCLKTGQHSIFLITYKENLKNNTRMLDTLFNDFIDIMDQYFH